MTTFLLLTVTGLGLAGLYFLVASGLSLIYGLMDVLNFAHAAFLTVGAYASWLVGTELTGVLPVGVVFVVALLAGLVVGTLVAVLMELGLVRRLYGDHVGQVLLTVGLLLAVTALARAVFGSDPVRVVVPDWMNEVTRIGGAAVPNSRLVVIVTAALVFAGLMFFLRRTRYGLVIRAGVENRDMVSALGIDVGRAFTLVFAIGGALASLAGILTGAFFGTITAEQGTSLLIFAFIVVIIGGLGSIPGSALAALAVGLLQQYANYYGAVGMGDLIVVAMLAVVLLVRPQGLLGRVA
ncbi:branched-chain amino acid ABC transporter permease [Nocardioides flavus (ex Wang et al. 2016)]|uniref:Branched-chain amino acid ABC transporter permease n=1 Tax=Nocardioides flavus (ex Wang et al. 2016) TaxID=2058780 RepID=A0ABQ3HJ63_9ACTN|nr:branched-chain amino acid ABC transporter permease [Nocardioides flavus (ex Wang et al. 2016)]GHE17712.1 branched-chain amino acid ABC transporter permease [Nocardioides flavus (ex Wang et al. 2016)]